MSKDTYLIYFMLPLVGACIGWLTNYIAVKMLFRPHRRLSLLGLKIQGVFSRRQAKLAEKVASLVSEELLSSEQLQESLSAASSRLDLRKVIVAEMDRILLDKLPAEIPMAAMLINNEVANVIKDLVARELEGSVSSTTKNLAEEFSKEVDIAETVREKIKNFSSEKLEALILSVMRQELKFIELFGALIGFVIGVVQVCLLELL